MSEVELEAIVGGGSCGEVVVGVAVAVAGGRR